MTGRAHFGVALTDLQALRLSTEADVRIDALAGAVAGDVGDLVVAVRHVMAVGPQISFKGGATSTRLSYSGAAV